MTSHDTAHPITPKPRPPRRRIGLLVGVALLVAIGGALAATSAPGLLSILDGVVGGGRGTHRTGTGIPFGRHGQSLDVWQPSGGQRRGLPVVIFWYGGGWTNGSRDAYAFAGRAFDLFVQKLRPGRAVSVIGVRSVCRLLWQSMHSTWHLHPLKT